jgi:homoserine O-acetyltransferase
MPLAQVAVAPDPALAEEGYDCTAPVPAGFVFDCGRPCPDASILCRLYGPEDAPLVIVAGGISASRFPYAPDGAGWWQDTVAPGGGVDIDRFRVLAFEFAPLGQAVQVSTADQARLVAAALGHLGVARAHAWVGASYGGMVGLAFAALYPERLGRLCAISAAHRASPMAVALRGVQRRIVEFGAESGRTDEALALARQLAMVTYRSSAEFAARFPGGPDESGRSDVCRYLISRGEAFRRSASPERWRELSLAIDRHQVRPEDVRVPTTLVASTTDWLTPISDMRELADRLPALESLVELQSDFGHDAFLKEAPRLNPILSRFLTGRPT